ncbi:hypothetical protein [Saccharothrix syringae]|uniref:hypothetical protein n=1 Tax=Saccharothrix syringae TaxID=103733 RepID=UPI0012F873CC|nr:hypothetical protein [Saccharothrix syringae]
MEPFPPEAGEAVGESQGGFPYQVNRGEPEVFTLHFGDVVDRVEFTLSPDVVIDGNDGEPYRVTGMGDRPRYSLAEGPDGGPKWVLAPYGER